MRTFLIDGYNLLFAFPRMPSGNWPDKRSALLHYLLKYRPHGNNHVVVVYDSREGSGNERHEAGVRIVFTAGETADDRIIAMVRQAANPRLWVVVSNDLGIRAMIRGTGARFMTATEFLQNAKAAGTAPPIDDSYRSEEITEELRKKWL